VSFTVRTECDLFNSIRQPIFSKKIDLEVEKKSKKKLDRQILKKSHKIG